jgi:polyisoprenoid-binding protein YceI
MKKYFFIALITATALPSFAQKYLGKNAKVTFTSKAPLETIVGTTNTATMAIDTKSGVLAMSLLVKSFSFEKKLMQQHFNDNYMESNKFPKAEFRGNITNNSKINYNADGKYNVNAEGKLTIHGVAQQITTTGTVEVKAGKIIATCNFSVQVSDYGVAIPSVVKDKVSNTVNINVSGSLSLIK